MLCLSHFNEGADYQAKHCAPYNTHHDQPPASMLVSRESDILLYKVTLFCSTARVVRKFPGFEPQLWRSSRTRVRVGREDAL